MGTRTVLVSGVGGNVGQGIVRSIRACFPDLHLVGTNTERLCGGTHLCDALHEVPYAYDPAYPDRIRAVVEREQVELLIPSTDYEAYHLSKIAGLPTVAISPPESTLVFLDKYRTWEVFSEHKIPFAESFLPSAYPGTFDKVIVKPREGRGSRGVSVDPADPRAFSDEYLVQRRHEGVEVTTAFYVTRQNTLHGHISMARTLAQGMTSACEVTFAYDAQADKIARAIMGALTVRGSCNIQSIVTADGQMIPFEINGRLSGTTSIRGQFGFEDARYTVEEYLFNQAPTAPAVRPGAALRTTVDVLFPGCRLADVTSRKTPHHVF